MIRLFCIKITTKYFKVYSLNLPCFSHLFKIDKRLNTIFDPFRKKHVKLTPEEWVRQNFLQYMIHELGFPEGLLSVEMGLSLNGLSRRCDIVAFDNFGKARVIVECKAPTVKITQKTFDQISAYNLKLKVDFLIVTNGLNHYCCKMDYTKNSYAFLEEIPKYDFVVSAEK